METKKFVVGLGGTLRAGSRTEAAMRRVLHHAEKLGAVTEIFSGNRINLPLYTPGAVARTPEVSELVDALRRADAVVLASPGYHGGISGLVKNAIDYTEELAHDRRPYLSGRPVGCIATAAGWQGANTTLAALRGVVHALRGWPTPFGIALNTANTQFDCEGGCEEALDRSFEIMARELLNFSYSAS